MDTDQSSINRNYNFVDNLERMEGISCNLTQSQSFKESNIYIPKTIYEFELAKKKISIAKQNMTASKCFTIITNWTFKTQNRILKAKNTPSGNGSH